MQFTNTPAEIRTTIKSAWNLSTWKKVQPLGIEPKDNNKTTTKSDTFGCNDVANNEIWKNSLPVSENSIIIYNPLSKVSSVEMALCSSMGIKDKDINIYHE